MKNQLFYDLSLLFLALSKLRFEILCHAALVVHQHHGGVCARGNDRVIGDEQKCLNGFL